MNKVKDTYKFTAILQLIGINPYVLIPENILSNIFIEAGRSKGKIPVCGFINELPYRQTLLKFKGEWRLYVNIKMLPDSPKRIGETINVAIGIDSEDRSIKIHPKFAEALNNDIKAQKQFEALTPSLQKEIIRYLSFLKREESITKNVALAIGFLRGENKFVARNPIKNKKI